METGGENQSKEPKPGANVVLMASNGAGGESAALMIMEEAPDNTVAAAERSLAETRQGLFSATHWSVVLQAGQEDWTLAAAALERLCQTYWPPIYAFIRRRGAEPHEAEDLTQAFFAFLLEKETVKRVDRRAGKFRTFLLTALTNFLNNEWDKRHALKRGGGREIISLDEATAENLRLREPSELTPESAFERHWAEALLGQVLARLKQEYEARGKATLFARLEPALTSEAAAGVVAEWGRELNMRQGALKVALHRLRRRFGELLRHEIAHTVSSPEEVDEEIRHLFAAIAH